MEKGDEVNVVDTKKSLSNSDFVTSTTHYHGRNNLDHPFLGDDGGGPYEMYRHGYGGSSFSTNSYSAIPYRPQGGMLGFPFTSAQLKELDRQAMVYKYMISSLPVPIHLLPQLDTSLSSIYSGRYSKNGDPEPGRCKRTDGKKWRCSKEVAPQQKYCERHLHRGRPRSRKPVEVKPINQKKTRPTVEESKSAEANRPDPLLLLNAKTDLTISTPPAPPYYTIREGKIVESEQQPWEDFMKSNCYVPEQYVNGGDLSPSLNLSMGNFVDHKSKAESMWLNPVSWEPFLGPLGEALQPSNPASPYNSMSTPATTVSSPSGVLHWTLFSQSDSSVCNSPTFVAAPPSEGSNQWHN